MSLFDSAEERLRKENLRLLEDKRLRFAQELDRAGFRPERMLFVSREDGSYVALARHEGRLALIVAPRFGQEGEFTLDLLDEPRHEREDFFEPGTGMNGAFGFGTKGARGFKLYITDSDGAQVLVPVIAGRNSWLEVSYRRNPLLRLKRRRGDANVVWDLQPIESAQIGRIEALIDERYLR